MNVVPAAVQYNGVSSPPFLCRQAATNLDRSLVADNQGGALPFSDPHFPNLRQVRVTVSRLLLMSWERSSRVPSQALSGLLHWRPVHRLMIPCSANATSAAPQNWANNSAPLTGSVWFPQPAKFGISKVARNLLRLGWRKAADNFSVSRHSYYFTLVFLG